MKPYIKKCHPLRFVFTLLLMVAFCPPAYADNDTKLRFLVHFFDLNESAYAYHRHCLSPNEQLNETFLKTLTFVADELLDETVKNSPQKHPEYIKNKILERRSNIQYKLDNAHVKLGCNSPAIEEAKVHYEEFSRYSTSEISDFIDEQTKEPNEDNLKK